MFSTASPLNSFGQTTAPSLTGSVALITGSSSGIGAAIARRLAQEGADCLIHGRTNRAGAERVVQEIQALGRKAEVVLADLAEPKGQLQVWDAAMRWGGERFCILVNNAGVDVLTGDVRRLSFEEKLAMLWRVDVCATLRLTRLALAQWDDRTNAAIVNIGWDQALQGMAGDSGELFSTVKGAVMAFSKSAAQSASGRVRVNCVAPGWIQTAWGAQSSPLWDKRARDESLLARWGTVDDIANAVTFLASPASSFINGQTLAVNGGFCFGRSDITDTTAS